MDHTRIHMDYVKCPVLKLRLIIERCCHWQAPNERTILLIWTLPHSWTMTSCHWLEGFCSMNGRIERPMYKEPSLTILWWKMSSKSPNKCQEEICAQIHMDHIWYVLINLELNNGRTLYCGDTITLYSICQRVASIAPVESILTWHRRLPWSSRRYAQCEACPLHFGWVDRCDNPKCGLLGCIISDSGGLRSRSPLIMTI